jgi:F-type H+-transporting ATPase subunit delta
MNEGKISVRYARAILNFAKKQGVQDAVYKEMFVLSTNLTDYAKDFKTAFAHPDITEQNKKRLFKLAVGEKISPFTSACIDFIVDKKRSSFMQRIALMYQTLYQIEHNIIISKVISAKELDKNTLAKIKEFASKKFVASIELVNTVDPSLIGGFILDIANEQLDASIKGKFSSFRKVL